MLPPGVAVQGGRRSMRAAAASLALHGGLLLLAVMLTGRYVVQSPKPQKPQNTELTSIEVVTPSPLPQSQPSASQRPLPSAPPVAPQVGPASIRSPSIRSPSIRSPSPRSPRAQPPSPRAPVTQPPIAATAGPRARRDPIEQAQSGPTTVKSLVDVTISQDPTSFASPRAPANVDAASGAARSGIGAGIDLRPPAGIANLEIPQPPTVSLARLPRPKHDYTKLRILGASKFAGETIKVLLKIDVRGVVHAVQLLQGVDRALDRKTVALVRTFEYEPALDDAGTPIPGTSRWDFQIVEDEDADPFDTAREHLHR